MFKRKPKSVDNILNTFTKAIDQLEHCEHTNGAHSEACIAEAERLRVAAEAHKEEAKRAAKVKDKLKELIGG